MRLVRIGLILAFAAPFAAAAGGHATVTPRGRCSTDVRDISTHLPAPVTITTKCGAFEIGRDGRVRSVPKPRSRVARQAHSIWSSGVWAGSSHGHLLVGRGRRTLWRSHHRFRREYEVETLAVGPDALAFSYGWHAPHLFVARFGGRERRVARSEYPLGWTHDGLYTNHRGAVLLRAPDGTLRTTVAHHVLRSAYDQASRSLWFVARGELFRAYGPHVRPVVTLARLGLTTGRSLQLTSLGRLLALQQRHRLVVLRRDGSVFASTHLPSQRRNMLFSGQPTVSPRGAAVAFAVLHPNHAIESQRIERGIETVYLLRAGSRAAVPIHRQAMRFNVCGHGANLTWHGDWLLYSTGEGQAAAIDTKGAHTIDLTPLVSRIPGFSGVEENGPLYVSWGSETPNPLL